MASIVPEVDSNTRVLAVLRATDPNPDIDEGDGHFLAEYCLLNQLLRNQGKEQVWLHAIDVDDAVRQYGPIIHGSDHFPPRKMVYGAPGLTLQHTQKVDEAVLRTTFLQNLYRMIHASQPGDRLLIILLGCGQESVGLSLDIWGHPEDTTQASSVITNEELDAIVQRDSAHGLSVCSLLSSRLGTNWICSSASELLPPISSGAKYMSGGTKGFSFIGAISEHVRRSMETTGPYRELCAEILEDLGNKYLLFDAQMPPRFDSQGDEWYGADPTATSLAQQAYAQRYDMLPTHTTPLLSPPDSLGLRQSIPEYQRIKNRL